MTDPALANGGRPHSAPFLVGREREQVLLREHLTGALAGGGGLVLIGGEAGIGKSALADACAAPYERALTLLALAELHTAAGNFDAALPPLTEASVLLTDLDARPALARAAALASTLDAATVAAIPSTRLTGLTPREMDVLRLVAQGRSNREVAGLLFVSVPTVKRHLSNVLAKLNLPSRSALTAYAHTHDLV